jgi:hypothetical protein
MCKLYHPSAFCHPRFVYSFRCIWWACSITILRGHIFHDPRGSTPFRPFCPFHHLTVSELYSFMVNTLTWTRWRWKWRCRRSTYDLSFCATYMGFSCLQSDSVQYIKTHSCDTMWLVCSINNVRLDVSAITRTIPWDDTAIMGLYTILERGSWSQFSRSSRIHSIPSIFSISSSDPAWPF